MSVYKEGFYIVRSIEEQSNRIYEDACDFGMLVAIGDKNWNNLAMLNEWYGVKGSRKIVRYETGTTLTTEFELMDEWQTGDVYRFRLTYVGVKGGIRTRKGCHNGYVYVEKIGTIKGSKVIDY